MYTPIPKKGIIIEDFKIIAEIWQSLLEEQNITVLNVYDNAENIENEVVSLSPDIILMDINLKGKVSGLELTKKLVSLNPAIRVLIVTINSEGSISTKAQEAGARGYISKNSSIEELKTAIDIVLNDQLYFTSVLANK